MKWLIYLSVVILSAQALPIDVGYEVNITSAEAYTGRSDKSFGFASFGSGTKGGQGGAVFTVWDAWALKNAISTNNARIVYVRGRIDLGVLFTGSPGVILDVGSYKSIIGGDNKAMIYGGGFRIKNNKQVIIQNIKFHNAISYAPSEKPNGNGGIVSQVSGAFTEVDAILCETATYVWIDHNEFADDPWNSNSIPNNRMRHDGLVDIKRASNYITVSHNIFRNHNKNMLIGHSDSNGSQDSGKLKISVQANWFKGTFQRNPRVRYGSVHVINNLYTDMGNYGIGVGAGAQIYAERNAFINSRAWMHPDGTPNPMGYMVNDNNLLKNSNYNTVPNSGVKWRPSQYFSYVALKAADVENRIKQIAGTW